MFRSVLSALSVLSLVAVVGCGGEAASATPPATPSTPAAPAADGAKPAAANLKAPGEAKVGDTTKCPISGEEFVVEATSPKVEHEGKTYYFCCGGCKKKFEADPAKYVKKS